MRERRIDVSELEPPQPMTVVLEALQALAEDEYVVLAHRREPFPLYAMLPGLGFAHRTRKGRATAFEVLIWRRAGPTPEIG
ncbi:MAG: DUF2249 domain-containing protein [Planctomycetes bacterium]|nr:DUF2249 domain-containing protein [Planctomycetota bacterium]